MPLLDQRRERADKRRPEYGVGQAVPRCVRRSYVSCGRSANDFALRPRALTPADFAVRLHHPLTDISVGGFRVPVTDSEFQRYKKQQPTNAANTPQHTFA